MKPNCGGPPEYPPVLAFSRLPPLMRELILDRSNSENAPITDRMSLAVSWSCSPRGSATEITCTPSFCNSSVVISWRTNDRASRSSFATMTALNTWFFASESICWNPGRLLVAPLTASWYVCTIVYRPDVHRRLMSASWARIPYTKWTYVDYLGIEPILEFDEWLRL